MNILLTKYESVLHLKEFCIYETFLHSEKKLLYILIFTEAEEASQNVNGASRTRSHIKTRHFNAHDHSDVSYQIILQVHSRHVSTENSQMERISMELNTPSSTRLHGKPGSVREILIWVSPGLETVMKLL